MKINALELRNFRCFRERRFTFSEGFSLLVGDNATGKTAILDAASIAAASLFLSLPGDSPLPIQRRDVTSEGFWKGQHLTFEDQYPASVTAEGEVSGKSVHWRRELRSKRNRTNWRSSSRLAKVAGELNDRVAAGEDTLLPVVSYYGAGRLWMPLTRQLTVKSAAKKGSRFDGYSNCLKKQINDRQFRTAFMLWEIQALQMGQPVAILEAVRKAVIQCLGTATDVRFEMSQHEMVVRFGDRAVPYSQLSDGYRGVLSMVADLASRCATLNPHLGSQAATETPGVVLIDEIDLHLHPRWQRHIVNDLINTFPRVQFIATTHSPFIIQSLPDRSSVQLLNLDDELRDDFADKSIEDIAETVQGVEDVQRSVRYHDMMATAREYYRLLREVKASDSGRREELKRKLDELATPFSDDPAYQAFLEMERVAAGLGSEHEAD